MLAVGLCVYIYCGGSGRHQALLDGDTVLAGFDAPVQTGAGSAAVLAVATLSTMHVFDGSAAILAF